MSSRFELIKGSPGDLREILKTSLKMLKEIENKNYGRINIDQYSLVRANARVTMQALSLWMKMSNKMVSNVVKMKRGLP